MARRRPVAAAPARADAPRVRDGAVYPNPTLHRHATLYHILCAAAGVDPASRQALWAILLASKARRALLLTTHFLDEADALADRVAILREGRLAAAGSALALKARFCDGCAAGPRARRRPPTGAPCKDAAHLRGCCAETCPG